MVYRNFSGYLRERYGGKIKKICVDGGFTCPNRDGTCGFGGCTFCGERGAGEHLSASRSISEQVRGFLPHLPKADGFIIYFQNFTNTYAPVEILRERYDAALIDDRIRALAIGTRPDCISEEIAALLESYTVRYDVWVELGLQTSDDETARRIHRGYESAVFGEAVSLLTRHHIPVVAHIILGLPQETFDHFRKTVAFLNRFPLWGIKVHSLYVMKGTALEKETLAGRYHPMSLQEYAEAAAYVLAHIPPEMVVHRLTGDCPRELLVAPEWNLRKDDVLRAIVETMERNGWVQGCCYHEDLAGSPAQEKFNEKAKS